MISQLFELYPNNETADATREGKQAVVARYANYISLNKGISILTALLQIPHVLIGYQ